MPALAPMLRATRCARACVAAWMIVSGAAAQTPPTPTSGVPQPPSVPAESDPAVEKSIAAYQRGVDLTQREQWGEALAAFEQAAAARDHVQIQFNVGYCQRALGRYVAASETFRRVVASPGELAAVKVDDAKAYVAELDAVLVTLQVTLEPARAAVSVDGRPLRSSARGFLASVAPPGEGTSPGRRSFTVITEPGSHLFRATRPGHQDVIVQGSYRAGEKASLDLRLDKLPGRVSVRSDPERAIVRVNGREAGLAPIDVERPAGRYGLEVVLDGFEPYSATLDLQAGQRSAMTAKLRPHEEPLTKKWWFWTGAAAVVVGGAALTYALTRPEPETPPYDGGNTGWVVGQLTQW